MSIKIGDTTIEKLYLGSTEIEKIYQGDTVIYSGGSEPPTPTPPSYDTQYLSFVALEDGTFSFSGISSASANTLQYSVDSGTTWTTIGTNTNTPTVQSGNKIMWKGSGLTVNNGIATFMSTGNFNVEGNVMSLVNGDDFATATTISNNYQFYSLFLRNTKLISTENMVLPATTLANSCYGQMFFGCTNLTTAPALPATTLVQSCYGSMFYGCTSLTTAPVLSATTLANGCYGSMFSSCSSLTNAPQLPATTLANSCYAGMFSYCTSLTTAPQLPATTLADYCYQYMFDGCTSLTTAPQLPATTLADWCYNAMFSDCTSLTTAPQLPATTLADYCYQYMFNGCTSLTTAPQLPATTLADWCYNAMFSDCTSLTTAPQLPATTLADGCYGGMFDSCTSLTAITCLATDISANYCTDYWVNGVASTGTFTSAVGMADWYCGNDGIPTDWTVVGGEPCQEGGYLEIDISGGGIDGADCFTVLPRYIVAITAPSGSRDMLAFSSSPCAHYDYRLNLRNGYILPIDLYQAVGGSEAYIIEEGSTLRGDSYTVILSDIPY